MKKISIISIRLLAALVFACKGKDKQLAKTEPEMVQEITEQWSNALNSNNVDSLGFLYADSVLMYGNKQGKYQILSNKAGFIRNNPDFKHIVGNIQLLSIGDGLYKTNFTKNVSYGGTKIEVEAQLIVQKQGGQWLIISESDKITEEKIERDALKAIAEDAAATVEFEQKISLSGTLSTTGYSDASGNKYTIYVLTLNNPINVKTPDPKFYDNQKNVKEIQVGFDESERPNIYLGKIITINGTIYGEETIHDRRPVVMIGATIEK